MNLDAHPDRARLQETALYQAMCRAIAECHDVDEVKEVRDRALAAAIYAQQVKNVDAERKVVAIRLRAERRLGELLREMKAAHERQDGRTAGPGRGKSKGVARDDAFSSSPPSLKKLGITRDQSSKYQQLAQIPLQSFEAALADTAVMPSTEGLLSHSKGETLQSMPAMNTRALWVWGRLKGFEDEGILRESAEELFSLMNETMQEDVQRLTPLVVHWLRELLLASDDEAD